MSNVVERHRFEVLRYSTGVKVCRCLLPASLESTV